MEVEEIISSDLVIRSLLKLINCCFTHLLSLFHRFSLFPSHLLFFPSFLFLLAPLQFGDSQQLRLVRILRSTVMVRVGGGWMALDEFLVKNDPCRGERRSHTNMKAS